MALCCGDVPLLGEPALVHGVVARVLHEPLLLPDHVVDLLVTQLPDHGVLNVFAFRFDFLRKFADWKFTQVLLFSIYMCVGLWVSILYFLGHKFLQICFVGR